MSFQSYHAPSFPVKRMVTDDEPRYDARRIPDRATYHDLLPLGYVRRVGGYDDAEVK